MPLMQRTAVTLSAGQAAGTTLVLAANPNRTLLIAGNNTATDARLDTADASGGFGMPWPAKGVLGFGAGDLRYPGCPGDAMFVGGLAAGDKITFWEA